MECVSLGKVALFIPLPWASGDEQYTNAKFMENAGSAVIIKQSHLTPELLADTIDIMMNDKALWAKAQAFKKTIPRDGAKKVVSVLASVLPV
jgi:UDP-N-acetylglucosamine--N-acetylmuramyl-(pentapeptide) pyrophosphoryl-undecaprenol N-acetylglucosamine transferase